MVVVVLIMSINKVVGKVVVKMKTPEVCFKLKIGLDKLCQELLLAQSPESCQKTSKTPRIGFKR